MDRDELRALQAPLKERYREQPQAAVVTLSATGSLGDGVSCSVQTGTALAEAGLHPASGGDGSLLCSGDMLLEALVAADDEQLATLQKLTERYCVVSRTLAGAPAPIGVSGSVPAYAGIDDGICRWSRACTAGSGVAAYAGGI